MKILLSTLMNEAFLGYYNADTKEDVEVFINPRSIKRMKPDIRAISDEKGDLFVIDDAFGVIHMQLLNWLGKNTPYVPNKRYTYDDYSDMLSKYIFWERDGKSDTFALGESYADDDAEFIQKDWVDKVRRKNPQYKFTTKIWGEEVFKDEA